jgi:hypothetical protein
MLGFEATTSNRWKKTMNGGTSPEVGTSKWLEGGVQIFCSPFYPVPVDFKTSFYPVQIQKNYVIAPPQTSTPKLHSRLGGGP